MTTHRRIGAHRRAAAPLRRPRRRSATAVVLAMLSGLGVVALAPTAGATVGVPVTYDDFTYSTDVKRPSENKPQSKLWYADGAWWGLLASPVDARVHIYELVGHSWRDTGTQVDPRLNSTGDALWDAASGTLTVASRASATNLQVNRFVYRPTDSTWTRADGFPVTVNTGGGSESATIDKDSTGRLWVTYTRAGKVWVAHSEPGGLGWTAGFTPNVPDVSIKSDDISALVAFRGQIGLLWSDQGSNAFRFARHQDGAPDSEWVVEDALSGPGLADDHINLKGLVEDSQGRLFAAVKTSQDTYGPGATLVGVLTRTPRADGSGSWQLAPAGTVADDHTRPIIMIDKTNQELYFFATAPVSGGDIYYKKAPLSNVSFGPGRGQKFIDSAAVVNNASGAKEPVTAETGMVILAVAEGKKRYVHGEMDLAGGSGPPPPAGDTTDPTTPTGLTATAGTGSVSLSWQASTDDVGVTGYRVRRDGTTINTGAGTTYADTSRPAGTYSYTVQALDAAGNASAQSAPVSATVGGEPPPPTGDGITLRAATTAANAAEATLTVPAPPTQAGDVLLASVDYRGQSAIDPPIGWNLVRADVNGTAMKKATYWRVAGSGEPVTWTWGFSAKPAAVGSILAYTGVSSTDPIETSGGAVTAKSTVVTAPAVTTQTPGALVVALFGVARACTITPPTDMTERTEVVSAGNVTYPMTAETADRLQPSVGATSAFAATSSVSGPAIGHTVVLRPRP